MRKEKGEISFHHRAFFLIKTFILCITIQLDISARLTPQTTTIICHHMKKSIIEKKKKERKYKNMGKLHQNPYVNKKDTYVDYIYS